MKVHGGIQAARGCESSLRQPSDTRPGFSACQVSFASMSRQPKPIWPEMKRLSELAEKARARREA